MLQRLFCAFSSIPSILNLKALQSLSSMHSSFALSHLLRSNNVLVYVDLNEALVCSALPRNLWCVMAVSVVASMS